MIGRAFDALLSAARTRGPDDHALQIEVARYRTALDRLTAEHDRAIAALEAMGDGIVMVDPTLHVERVNAAAVRLLRLKDGAPQAAGQSLAQVLRDHELHTVLTTALTQGAPHSATVRLAPPGNGEDARDEPRYVKATGIPLDEGAAGAPRAAILVLQDVTELRRTETVRREFVGNVSHELRTPIASLKALVETLEEGALDDPPAAREFLAQMHVEVDSLAQLVQELLELSRIESGQASLRPEAVRPAGLLEEVSRRLRRQAERADVDLVVAPTDEVPAMWVDPALVERVLINLVHNALKFTPRHGRVTLDATPLAGGVCLSVADTGIGIEPEDAQRIFERFFKVDRSRASGGTGLGLAIAKHIVQAHGGRIWAESAGEGHGSTFKLLLPFATATS